VSLHSSSLLPWNSHRRRRKRWEAEDFKIRVRVFLSKTLITPLS